MGIGVAALQLEVAAFKQIGDAPGVECQQVQMRAAALRDEVVPVPVVRLAGGDPGVLAGTVVFHRLGLGFRALAPRPDPGDEDDVTAARAPAKGIDPGGHLAHAPGFTAIGGDHIELWGVVFAALLLALGDEADAVTAWRERGRAVFLAALGQAAGRSALGAEQPQRAAALVVGHRGAGQRAHRQRTVGRQTGRAQPLQLPQGFKGQRLGFFASHEGSWWGWPCSACGPGQRGRMSWKSRCARTVGHSSAVML